MSIESLYKLAADRVSLPRFGPPGASLPEQLELAQAEASAAMQKYVEVPSYNERQLSFVLHQVETWVERHKDSLKKLLAGDPRMPLPEAMEKLVLGKEQARNFVVASYVLATKTLGPWVGNGIFPAIQRGELTEAQAREDAKARLSIFGSIVVWDQDGTLAKLFGPDEPEQAASGLGALPVGVVIVIAASVVVALLGGVALILHWIRSLDVVRRNAALMDKICSGAIERGEQDVVQSCVRYAAGLQRAAVDEVEGLAQTASDVLSKLVWAAALIAGTYVVAVHIVPHLLGERERRTRAEA